MKCSSCKFATCVLSLLAVFFVVIVVAVSGGEFLERVVSFFFLFCMFFLLLKHLVQSVFRCPSPRVVSRVEEEAIVTMSNPQLRRRQKRALRSCSGRPDSVPRPGRREAQLENVRELAVRVVDWSVVGHD